MGRERRTNSFTLLFLSVSIAVSRTSSAKRLYSVYSSVASGLGVLFMLRGIVVEDTLPLVDGELGGSGVDKKMRTYGELKTGRESGRSEERRVGKECPV